jgi:hypothetical protein
MGEPDVGQELAKAKIVVTEGRRANEEIAVLFNPTEYSLEISNHYQKSGPPGLSNPIIQFVNGEADQLSMDLYFDTHTDGGGRPVTDTTQRIASLMWIDSELHAPPRILFQWGQLTFKAVIEKLTQRFTMFRSDGIPVRATLNLSFTRYRTLADQLVQPRLQSADKTKRRVMSAADSIWLIAHREYGEVRFWRTIARTNRIEDPRAIAAGDVLIVPQLEDFAAVAKGRVR